jgi:tRNA threonylcarbamoyl adenosine modification protein (Sua5/YciO/YrdC/YwlC family)
MLVYEIHPVNPQKRFLEATVKILQNGGIAVYPTDTVYGMGSCIDNPHALDRISRIIEKDKQRLFSFICKDFSQVSQFVKMSNFQFKLMKRYLPGPYTFILNATNLVPKKITPKRRTVGIRIPDCIATLNLVEMLGVPLANTSINTPGELRGDPEAVKSAVMNEVDVMLDAGPLENPEGSTIVDLTGESASVLRYGKGKWDEI